MQFYFADVDFNYDSMQLMDQAALKAPFACRDSPLQKKTPGFIITVYIYIFFFSRACLRQRRERETRPIKWRGETWRKKIKIKMSGIIKNCKRVRARNR